jgi:hypothetical protein
MTTEIKHYLEIKSIMNRLEAIGAKFSLEWRIKDGIKDMLRDGFSKEDIQLILTIIVNEQFEIAEEEYNETKEQ